MMERLVERGTTGVGLRGGVGCLLWAVLVWTDPTTTALAVPVVLATPTRASGPGLVPYVLWLSGGAVVGGLLGWGIAVVGAPGATLVGLGFGLAIGGGFGVVLRLATVDEPADRTSETVTVDMDDGDASGGPQPADLFESHPDPILYYEASGDGPVVRTTNEAFAETFGVTATGVEDAALSDASMVTTRRDDLVEAATGGGEFDAVVDCETHDGEQSFRVRLVAVTDGVGARGYVLYSPTRSGD